MKKIITLILFSIITLYSNAKTHYVASHYESIRVEVFDSLGNVIDSLSSFDETRHSILCKTINDLQFSVFSLTVSEEENKAIKRAKNAQGWSMAAAISSAVSYGINRGMSISTRGFRSFDYHIRAVNSAIALDYSMYGLERASMALNRLKNFEGIAFVVHNPTSVFKNIIVDNVNISIMPKGDYPILIKKNKPVIIGMELPNKQFCKVRITADRLVYKLRYDFEYNGYYYMTKHNTTNTGTQYIALDIDNPNDKLEVLAEDYQMAKKASKKHPSQLPLANNMPTDSLNIKVYVRSLIIHKDINCTAIKNREKIKEFIINNKNDFDELQDKYWTCGKCLGEKITFEEFINLSREMEENSSKAIIN